MARQGVRREDPLTGRELRFRKTRKTEVEAQHVAYNYVVNRSRGGTRRHRSETHAGRLPVLQPAREYPAMEPGLGNTAARLGHAGDGDGATTLKHYADPVSEVDRRAAAYLATIPRLRFLWTPVSAIGSTMSPVSSRSAGRPCRAVAD